MSTWEELTTKITMWDLFGSDGNWRGRLLSLDEHELQEGETVVELQVLKGTMETERFFEAVVAKIDELEARIVALES